MSDQRPYDDPARRAALAAMKAIRGGAYANLAVQKVAQGLTPVDAGFVAELVFGTCRYLGTLDKVIELAAGRELRTLQPGVVDVLRLGAEQVLRMRVPAHAAVSASVSLAADQIGPRVAGVVNAILRRVAAQTWDEWMDQAANRLGERESLALRTAHPEWIVDAYAEVLPADELSEALEANNRGPAPVLVVRPGLASRDDLVAAGAEPTRYSPWGAVRSGDPADLALVRDGRAGVQDEGSQLVAGIVALVSAPPGPWLDMCAGPGGKTALLTGLARRSGETVVGADVHFHRARLVAEALRAYGHSPVLVADGRRPAWNRVFSRAVVDAPCSGLGALRRRPEARWRKSEADLAGLARLQTELLTAACASVVAGGVVAYITCSPLVVETAEVVVSVASTVGAEIVDAPALLPGVPRARAGSDDRFVQLWPHRHQTDAMFCAVLRVP